MNLRQPPRSPSGAPHSQSEHQQPTSNLRGVRRLGVLLLGLVPASFPQVAPETHNQLGTHPLTFSVASVRPTTPNASGWRLQFTLDGFVAESVTLQDLIEEAYGISQTDRLMGIPPWASKQRFDVKAKVDEEDLGTLKSLTLDQRREMLRRLLADRMHLVVRQTRAVIPVYALVIAKTGAKLKESPVNTLNNGEIRGVNGSVRRQRQGLLEVEGSSMSGLAQSLSFILGKTVVDQTGLPGRYDVLLQWSGDADAVQAADSTFPSLFTAIDEQLGLRLQASKLPVDVVLIDHAAPPSAE